MTGIFCDKSGRIQEEEEGSLGAKGRGITDEGTQIWAKERVTSHNMHSLGLNQLVSKSFNTRIKGRGVSRGKM